MIMADTITGLIDLMLACVLILLPLLLLLLLFFKEVNVSDVAARALFSYLE